MLGFSQNNNLNTTATTPNYRECFKYNEDNNIIYRSYSIDEDGNGMADSTEEIYYNDNGNISCEIFYMRDAVGNTNYKEEFCYDNNGNITSESFFMDTDGNGVLDVANSYYYDEYGTLRFENYGTLDNNENMKQCIRYNYDKNGDLIVETLSQDTDNDGLLDYSESVILNNGAEKILTTSCSQDTDNDGVLDYSECLRSDENNNPISKIQTIYDNNKNLKQEIFSSYDESGYIFLTQETNFQDNKISVTKISEDENLDGVYETEIVATYDSNGEIIDTQYNFDLESDQEIGLTRQNGIGDCWLLAGLSALNNTSFGKEIIKNAITVNDDGSYSIYFKGIDTSYSITEEEIINAKLQDIYSKGDVDTLIMELAFEKAFSDKNNANTELTTLNEDILNISNANDYETHVLDGGLFQYVTFLLTGQDTVRIDKNYLKNIDPKTTATFISFLSGSHITDINGNKVLLCGGKDSAHAWCLKAVEDDVATIINPHNSNNEIKVDFNNLIKKINSRVDVFDTITSHENPYYSSKEESKSFSENLFDFIFNPIGFISDLLVS